MNLIQDNQALKYIGQFKINTDYICHSLIRFDGQTRPNSGHTNLTAFSNNRFKAEFSQKSRSDLRKYISHLVSISPEKLTYCQLQKRSVKFQVNFMTLTLPSVQIHADKTIKDVCLGQFMQELKIKYNVQDYVWKAEKQGNGNIHFHVTINQYIHYSVVRNIWNRCVQKLGYIDRFENKNGHRTPPSTEIKSIKNVRKLAAYLSAYLTSKKKDDTIIGRNWSVSQTLSKFNAVTITEDSELYKQVCYVISKINPPGKSETFYTLHYSNIKQFVEAAQDLHYDELIVELNNQAYSVPDLLCILDPSYILKGVKV